MWLHLKNAESNCSELAEIVLELNWKLMKYESSGFAVYAKIHSPTKFCFIFQDFING